MSSSTVSNSPGGIKHIASQNIIDAFIARKKHRAIDKLMEMFEEWLDQTFPSYTTESYGSASVPAARSGTTSAGNKAQSQATQKRPRHGSFDDQDRGGVGNSEDKRVKKRSRVEEPVAPRYACPYFKHNPTKWCGRQACTGPGWHSVAKLKEHIYRAHRQAEYMCNRCCDSFESAELLKQHQRVEEPCKISKEKQVDGINETQYQQLRKKPSAGKKTCEERWGEVYRIIFPKAVTMPSPFYEYQEGSRASTTDSDALAHETMQDELLIRVRNALEDRFDRFEENTKTELVDLVRTELNEIYKQYHAAKPKRKATTPGEDAEQSFVDSAIANLNDSHLITFDCFTTLTPSSYDGIEPLLDDAAPSADRYASSIVPTFWHPEKDNLDQVTVQ